MSAIDQRLNVTPWSLNSVCQYLASSLASATWPAANRAIAIPFRLASPFVAQRIKVFNGAAVSGNLDVGIYDRAFTRLGSSGSTAQAGTNAVQVVDITDIELGPGLFYLALALDNATGTLFRAASTAEMLRTTGMVQMAAAFALPANITPASIASAYLPYVALEGISRRSSHYAPACLPTLTTFGPDAVGPDFAHGLNTGPANAASGVNPVANKAFYVPFVLSAAAVVTKLFCYNGATVNGNVDVGIYDERGRQIVSSGAVAQAGTNALQEFDVTDTQLGPGRYYLALSSSSGTATFFRVVTTLAAIEHFFGWREEAAAHPLPASATFANISSDFMPVIGALVKPRSVL